ncbi:hypothetical protein OSTOST_10951, partial [Ostertagia ostertagi]
MDQFPSGSAPIELDKEFCVKNIPAHFVDVVIMENMNGADEVRSQLRNGKYLSVDNGLQLLVTGVRHGESQRSREEARGENNRPPLKELRGDGMMVKGRCGDRLAPQKSQRSYTAVKCFSQDLPLQTPTKVGQYVLYCRDTIAFRALCNSDTTLYLID